MTKVIDLTEEAKEEKVLKWIELVYFIADQFSIVPILVSGCKIVSNSWDSLTLLCKDYRKSGYDLMFASNEESQCLYLGHFNDGII